MDTIRQPRPPTMEARALKLLDDIARRSPEYSHDEAKAIVADHLGESNVFEAMRVVLSLAELLRQATIALFGDGNSEDRWFLAGEWFRRAYDDALMAVTHEWAVHP